MNFWESITGNSKVGKQNLRQFNSAYNASRKILSYKEAPPVVLKKISEILDNLSTYM